MQLQTEAEVLRLRVLLSDLAALSAVPAASVETEAYAVPAGLADALTDVLQLDFAFVRLADPGGAGALDSTRGSAWNGFPDWLEHHLATRTHLQEWEIVPDVGDGSEPCRGIAIPIGVDGRSGLIAAAAARHDFPTDMDELLLSHAADHAATALQNARLVEARRTAEDELQRARGELEVKVAESAAELHVANEALSALRRLAALVAEGVEPQELFAVVAEEVSRVVDIPAVSVVRYEPDGTAFECANYNRDEKLFPVGVGTDIEDTNVLRLVRDGSASARIDDDSQTEGEMGHAVRSVGIRSTVGVPIVVAGRVWGAIAGSTLEATALPPDTEARLVDFTELLASAIENAESKSELAASRRRIVAASDEERRRIERNLHDGTQQRLVSLGLAVRTAEADVPPDRSDLRGELRRIATGLADAVEELREISHGIHPAILSEGGLGPALRALARRSAIPVALDVTDDIRLPEPIEVAAYFVASEALANAAKHAHAAQVDVSLSLREGSLLLSIDDDGIGGADPARGSGLLGLTDRVEALGGSIEVSSRPGTGTHITAELPPEPVGARES